MAIIQPFAKQNMRQTMEICFLLFQTNQYVWDIQM